MSFSWRGQLSSQLRITVNHLRDLQQRPRLTRTEGAGAGCIYYITPDYAPPAGGIRVMYRHVDHLNEAGIAASVLHAKNNFRCTWFENRTRVDSAQSVRIGRSDLLVVPEIYAGRMPAWLNAHPHVIFNQNAYLTLRAAASASIASAYREASGLLRVLTVSDDSQRLLSYMYPETRVDRIRVGVDTQLFYPSTQRPERRLITYMPRRGRDEGEYVIEALRQRGALQGWEVRALDGLSHESVAAELRGSNIFLSFTHQEGFGLPAAEAMACGNLVIGFDGGGGREFFRPQFSYPIAAGDLYAFASTVESVLDRERKEPGWCRELGTQASRHIADTYSVDAERSDVVEFFKEMLP